MATKKTATGYPARIRLKDGPKFTCVAPSGGHIAVLGYYDRGRVVVVERGGKPATVRLRTDSGMFPPRDDAFWSQEIVALHVVVVDGAPRLLALWGDDFADGPGVGLFDLDGTARRVRYFLDDGTRRARLGATSITSAGHELAPTQLVVSPDGARAATQLGYTVAVWTLDALLGGGAPDASVHFPAGTYGIAFGARGTRVMVLESWAMSAIDVATGAASKVALDPVANSAPNVRVFGCGPLALSSGAMVDDDGRLVGRFPGEIRAATAAGRYVVAVGGPYRDERVWIADAASGALEHEVPAPGAGLAIAARADEFVVTRGVGSAVVLDWPRG